MSENLKSEIFSPSVPHGGAFTREEAGNRLLIRLEERGGECQKTLWELVVYYSETGQQERAVEFVERLLELSNDSEECASCMLTLGQLMEQMNDFGSAKVFYELALALKPREKHTSYFIHNNLGYSLIQLGLYEDAESYLKRAISIDPQRLNGHKNLGLACEGLGRLEEAAECYVTATKLYPSDTRSLAHLENLLSKNPNLYANVLDLQTRLDSCRNAVQRARASMPDFWAN